MTDRRQFLVMTGGLCALTACGPGGPGAVTVNATGAAGMNPGPDGTGRPLMLQVLQLKATGAFNTADVFALQDPAAALGGDLISATAIPLAPGGTASKVITLDPSVTALGIVAGFRDPAGKQFRSVTPIDPGATATAVVTAGPGGLSVSVS